MATFISSRGLRWHYQMQGEHEAILFIHGFGGESRWWVNQQEYFSRHFNVIVVDLPGHGQTPFMPLTPTEIAIDLKQLLFAQGIGQVNVVASSMGALMAFELYRQAHEMVMRLSMVGGMPKFARSEDYPAGLDIERIRKMSSQFQGDYAGILDIFFRSLFSPEERSQQQWRQLQDFRKELPLPTREALIYYLNILETVDLRDRFSRIICPQQYVAGSQDYICPPAVMDWLNEHAYNARCDRMEGLGHLPFLTEPKEYNRLLEDFLLS